MATPKMVLPTTGCKEIDARSSAVPIRANHIVFRAKRLVRSPPNNGALTRRCTGSQSAIPRMRHRRKQPEEEDWVRNGLA